MSNEYTLKHITDIAKIPADRFDVFMAELPNIIEHWQMLYQLAGDDLSEAVPEVTWVDDGMENIDVDVIHQGETLASIRIKGDD